MSKVIVGTLGQPISLLLRQGMAFGPYNVLLKADGVAVDMTGSVVRGHIRESHQSTSYVPFTIVIVNSSTVSFTFDIDPEDADTLVRSASPVEAPYVWDIEWVDAALKPRPVFYGDLKVRRRVTRA